MQRRGRHHNFDKAGMAATPEQRAREEFDRLLLLAAGRAVQDMATIKMLARAFSA
jgi:hypothetical protein